MKFEFSKKAIIQSQLQFTVDGSNFNETDVIFTMYKVSVSVRVVGERNFVMSNKAKHKNIHTSAPLLVSFVYFFCNYIHM